MVSGRPRRRGLDTFDDLLTEAVVLVGAARLRGEGEDRLPVGGLSSRRMLLLIVVSKTPPAKDRADGLLNVAREGRPLVVEGDDGAQELSSGLGRALIRSTVSSRSSVPSRAK